MMTEMREAPETAVSCPPFFAWPWLSRRTASLEPNSRIFDVSFWTTVSHNQLQNAPSDDIHRNRIRVRHRQTGLIVFVRKLDDHKTDIC